MKTLIFSLFLGLFVLISAGAAAANCTVAALGKPYRSGHYVVDFPRSQINASVKPGHFPFLSRFQKKMQAHTSVEVRFLLKRQRKFFENFEDGTRRFDQVLSGRLGRFHAVNCLEAFLLDAHLSQMKERSEFMALILAHPRSAKKRVIVSTQNEMSVSTNDRAWRLFRQYLKEGWILEEHLHNHPFALNNPYGDIAGTPIPSEADFATYRELKHTEKLKKAVVTNGFDSLELRAREF